MNSISDRQRLLLGALTLFVMTVVVFSPARDYGFIDLDDDVYVFNNPHILQGITLESVKWAFTTNRGAHWHPVTWLSHMLDIQLFGLNAGQHHLVSVVLHAVVAALWFLVLVRFTHRFWFSLAVAALFAVHPLRVESVVWICERKDILSSLFWALSIAAYLHYLNRRCVSRYALLWLSFLLGLMSKPMIVTLPIVLILMDLFALDRLAPKIRDATSLPAAARWWRILADKIPLLILSALSGLITIYGKAAGRALADWDYLSLTDRVGHALVAYVQYLHLTFWPIQLAVLYPHPGGVDSLLRLAWSIIILVVATGAAFHYRKRQPFIFLGWTWFLITLLPVIGLLQVGTQGWANRFTYIPHMGLLLAIACVVDELADRILNRLGLLSESFTFKTTTCLVFLILAIWATRFQMSFWQSSEVLLSRSLAVAGESPIIRNNLGLAIKTQGRLEEALSHFFMASRSMPDSSDYLNNLADTLLGMQRDVEALDAFSQSLKLNTNQENVHLSIGVLHLRAGRPNDAADHFEQALELKPAWIPARSNYGVALWQADRKQEAYAVWDSLLEENSDLVEDRRNRARALMKDGELRKAADQIQIILIRRRDDLQLELELSTILLQLGENEEALSHLNRILSFVPGNLDVLIARAETYHHMGRWPDALNDWNKILKADAHHLEALNNSAWIMISPEAGEDIWNPKEGLRRARLAAELTRYEHPVILNTLSRAYEAQTNAQKTMR